MVRKDNPKIVTTRDPEVARILAGKAGVVKFPGQYEKYQHKWRTLPPGNAQWLHKVLPSGSWKGSRCFVIGGGPSLQGFDFEQLRGQKIIAVNRAYETVPFADIMFSMDNRYYQWIHAGRMGEDAKQKYLDFEGYKTWLNTWGYPYRDCYQIRGIGKYGVSLDLEYGLYHGTNSGYGALGLAIALGAEPIYLLGYDMGVTPDKTHYHGGYPTRQNRNIFNAFKGDFAMTVPEYRKYNIKAINLNPDSALTVFPKQDPEKFFAKMKKCDV